MASSSRRQQIEAMLAEDPKDPFLHYALAMEHVGAGQLDEAVKRFEELLGIDPGYVPAYFQAGRALNELGRTEEARTLLRTGIATATHKGDAHAAGEMEGLLESL